MINLTREENNTPPELRFKFTSMEEWERWSKMKAPENMGTHRGAWLEGEWAGYSQCMVNEVKRRDEQIDSLQKERDQLKQDKAEFLELLNEMMDSNYPGCNYSIPLHWRGKAKELITKHSNAEKSEGNC